MTYAKKYFKQIFLILTKLILPVIAFLQACKSY